MERDAHLERAILAARAQLLEQRANHVPGITSARNYAIALEHALEGSIQRVNRSFPKLRFEQRCAVIMTGGTGRREQALHSDIDLGFIFSDEPGEEDARFIGAFLFTLYDLRIDVGHWTRTPDDVYRTIGKDIFAATSYVGARFLWGNPSLFTQTQEQVYRLIRGEQREWFLGAIQSENAARHVRDATVFLLQPHIKDSRGGLRDLQSLGWIGFALSGKYGREGLIKRGMLTATEHRKLREAHSFLLDVRSSMHQQDGRGADQLTFERQHKAARDLVFVATETMYPEELLMRKYYGHANLIDRLCSRVLRQVARLLAPPRKEVVKRRHVGVPFVATGNVLKLPRTRQRAMKSDPGWMLDYFRIAATEDFEIDEKVLQTISARADEIDDDARRSPLNRTRFMAVLSAEGRTYQILSEMHRWGVLGAYLPEFQKVENLPRIDHYHVYSVDEHLLRSVAACEDLRNPESARGRTQVGFVAQNVLRPDLLKFSLLLHDVGKWKPSGHVMRGAHMIKAASERMGFTEREQDILYLLVNLHQRMGYLIGRRDPEDPNSAKELAQDVDEVEHLRMLFVHTACDMIAVSPASWNEWRAAQLTTLYFKTLAVLKGRKNTVSQLTQIAPIVTKVLAAPGEDNLESERQSEELEHFLADLPERYRRATSATEMRRHFELWRDLHDRQRLRLVLNPKPGANYSEITCIAHHEHSLFSNLCGAIASRRLNILSAQVFLGRAGACINVFQVQSRMNPEKPPERDVIERLEARLNSVLLGDSSSEWKMPDAPELPPNKRDDRTPRVRFDNDVSPIHTVLEIKARDRPGVLWRIASILEQNRVAVALALISTEAFRIVDVFYVTDLDMNKISSPPMLEKLRLELIEELSPPDLPPTESTPDAPA